jgi:hypothetical protein
MGGSDYLDELNNEGKQAAAPEKPAEAPAEAPAAPESATADEAPATDAEPA